MGRRFDLPAIPEKYRGDPLYQPLVRMREEMRSLLGLSEAAPALYALLRQQGLVGGGSGSGGAPGGVIVIPGEPGEGEEPDMTPPPDVGDFAVTAFLGHVLVEFAAGMYSQGHGPLRTNVYIALRSPSTDPALTTFSDATRMFEATHPLTLAPIPIPVGTRVHVWLKYETRDGVESVNPSGGINGVQATVGLINGQDLAPLLITARELAAGTYAGLNLVPNPGAEDGTAGWMRLTGGTGTYAFDSVTSDKAAGSRSFTLTKAATSAQAAAACRAFPVIPGETYSVKVRIKGASAGTGGRYVFMLGKASAPPSGFVENTAGSNFYDASTLLGPADATFPTAWTQYEYTYQAPAGTYWASVAVYNWDDGPTQIWFDEVNVGRQITASFIAAQTIVAGSAIIADAAIRTALIEDAAVTNAKVLSLAASKLTAGSIGVGEYIRSTGYVPGSAGWNIPGNGFAELSDVIVRGTVYANAGLIGGIVINAGDIRSSNYVPLTAGFRFNSSGSAEIADLYARGSINNGAFSGWAWPAAGAGGGFHLGPNGLLLGNANGGAGSNGYFQVTASGEIYAPGLSIAGGAATFSGALSAASGTFAGALAAATGTFAGVLAADTVNAVSELNIRGEAVRVQRGDTRYGPTGLGGGWATLAQPATITVPAGTSLSVRFNCEFDCDAFDPGEGISRYYVPYFRILRNGSLIWSGGPRDGSILTPAGGSYAMEIIDTPGAGAWYYTFEGYTPAAASGHANVGRGAAYLRTAVVDAAKK